MKKFIYGFSLLFSFTLLAQNGFVMLNQNKVEFANQGKAFKLVDDYFSPVWNDLVNEGKIYSYQVMTHLWGDEWNLNYIIVAESHEKFLSAWSEGFRRIRSSMPPEKWDELFEYTIEHKDNLYNLRSLSPRNNSDELINVVEMSVNNKTEKEINEFASYYQKLVNKLEPNSLSFRFFNHAKNVSPGGEIEKDFAQFMNNFTIDAMTIYGESSSDLKKLIKSFGLPADYIPYIDGFSR
jgi:hypothetical protein